MSWSFSAKLNNYQLKIDVYNEDGYVSCPTGTKTYAKGMLYTSWFVPCNYRWRIDYKLHKSFVLHNKWSDNKKRSIWFHNRRRSQLGSIPDDCGGIVWKVWAWRVLSRYLRIVTFDSLPVRNFLTLHEVLFSEENLYIGSYTFKLINNLVELPLHSGRGQILCMLSKVTNIIIVLTTQLYTGINQIAWQAHRLASC